VNPELDLESAAYVLYVAQREVDSIPYTAPEVLVDRLRQVVSLGQELLDEIRRLREGGDMSGPDRLRQLEREIERAEARAVALQEKIDRCVAHIREGQQLQPDEPDAGLEALVVGWTKYHGSCCSFKSRAEKAEAEVERLREAGT
jgi:hypothetical protein